METAWAITAAVVAAALGIELALMALGPSARWTAISFFVLSALWLGGVGFVWLVQTPASLLARIAAGLGIGAFVFVIVPLLIRFALPIEGASAQPPSPATSGGTMPSTPYPTPAPASSSTGSITTTNQSGGINNTGQMTINQEDRSVKRQLRDLLNSIDARILADVEGGQTQLTVRMQPFEEMRLKDLIAQDGSYIAIVAYGRTFIDSTLMNGTLGPQYPVHEQQEVLLRINRSVLP